MNVLQAEFEDYDDFVKRYGKVISKNQVPMSFMMVGSFNEQIGVLVKNELLDASLVGQLFAISPMWVKMKPIVEGLREEYHSPELFEWFEYLYNEMKKREQQLASKRLEHTTTLYFPCILPTQPHTDCACAFKFNCSNLPAAFRLVDVTGNTLTTTSTQLQQECIRDDDEL